MRRAIVLLLDSFGIGASQDATAYGDTGADTFGHIAEACAQGKGDHADLRQGPLHIPHLVTFGLAHAALASTGKPLPNIDYTQRPQGIFGYAVEQSHGKDTPSGHWEIAGLPVKFDWGIFPPDYPSFPEKLLTTLITRGKLPGVIGNKHASGTTIIEELGQEHIKSLKPIVYTSGDSVFQIAAHESHFGLERLYQLCEIARELVDEYHIGRVIARPFLGDAPGKFERTANRRDYATPPHGPTLLDQLIEANGTVIAIGKTADIFAHQGISQNFQGKDNDALFQLTLTALQKAKDKTLIFTNLSDFDSKYGHRRNIPGYAHALETLDAQLPLLTDQLQPGDLLIITADHGCDPSFPGSDHTREHIPILGLGPGIASRFVGRRETFADIGQSIASHLQITALAHGVTFI